MAEFCQVTLAELVAPGKSGFATGPFGSSVSSKHFVTTGTPMIRGTNLSRDVGVRLSDEDLVFLDHSVVEKFARSVVSEGDLIFTSWGTVGQIGLIDSRAEYAEYVVSNKQMKMTPDRSKVDPLFLYYFLSQPRMIALIEGQAIGSSVPGFNLGQLRALPVVLPAKAEQRSIVAVLGALDDKIAANRAIATTSDELIRLLVERAQLNASTCVAIDRIAQQVRESVNPTMVDPGLPYVGLEHISRRSIWLDRFGTASEVTSLKWMFRPGDILFGKLRPYFHKVVVAGITGICSTDILVCRPRNPELAGLVAAKISSDAVISRVTSATEGTRMPRTNWKDLAAVQVPWPGEVEARELSDAIRQIWIMVESTMRESVVLNELRDALLPHLMSGRLRVRDAEKQVGEVV